VENQNTLDVHITFRKKNT